MPLGAGMGAVVSCGLGGFTRGAASSGILSSVGSGVLVSVDDGGTTFGAGALPVQATSDATMHPVRDDEWSRFKRCILPMPFSGPQSVVK
jgi:hypothetical protein